jgi:hypothetical protein
VLTVKRAYETDKTTFRSLGFAEPGTKLLSGDKIVVIGGKDECSKLLRIN